MENQPDKLIRVERTIENGEVVSEKQIVEPITPQGPKTKKLFGLDRKDQFDLGFKIVGLVTILLAILQFTNQMNDRRIAEAEKVKKEYRDSINGIAARKQQLEKSLNDKYQLEVENRRKDYELELQRLGISKSDQASYRDFAQREEQFREEYLRQMRLFNSQVGEGRVNEFAVRQYEAYAKIAFQISKMQTSVNSRILKATDEEEFKGQVFQSQLLEKDSIQSLADQVIESYRKTRGLANSIQWYDSWYDTLNLVHSEVRYYMVFGTGVAVQSAERTLNRLADFCIRVEKDTRDSYQGIYPMAFNAFFRTPKQKYFLELFDSLSKYQLDVITECKNLIFGYYRIFISGQKQNGIAVDEYARLIDFPSKLYERKQAITNQSLKDTDSSLSKVIELMHKLKFRQDMAYANLKLDFNDAAGELMNYMNRKKIFAGRYNEAGK